MVELIDMFYPDQFNITLVLSIYIIHRSFYKVNHVELAAQTVIALCENFFMVKYLHVHPLTAMVLTIVIFPVMSFLWAMAEEKLHPGVEIPRWQSPYPHWHMPHHARAQGKVPVEVTRTAYRRRS